MARSGAALVAASLPASYQSLAATGMAAPTRPPVRTVTAGVKLQADDPAAGILRAAAFLQRAREHLQAAGLTVQTTRIVTQAYSDYTGGTNAAQRRELFRSLLKLAQPHSLAVGPARLIGDDPSDVIEGAVTAATLGISSTINVGTAATGVQSRAIDAAAKAIRAIADRDAAANFNFAAVANVPAGIPFFPAGYHDGGPDNFALGLEAAGLFLGICREVRNLDAAGPALTEAYGAALRPIEQLAMTLAAESGWHYRGIDPTPAQWGDNSIGGAVEALTGSGFGLPGTLAACRVLTGAVRAAPVRQVGFRGLFLPPMEDATLATRAHDNFGLDSLLTYSAVCGTGLDTVALPGDSSQGELTRILRDMASLAVKLDKPLTARLFPVPGGSVGESTGPVGDLFPMKILRVR